MAQRLTGSVIAIDENGSAITDITSEQLEEVPTDESVWISCEGHRTNTIFPSDHSQPEMSYIAVLEDDGILQLVLVGDSASKFLGIGVGAEVELKW